MRNVIIWVRILNVLNLKYERLAHNSAKVVSLQVFGKFSVFSPYAPDASAYTGTYINLVLDVPSRSALTFSWSDKPVWQVAYPVTLHAFTLAFFGFAVLGAPVTFNPDAHGRHCCGDSGRPEQCPGESFACSNNL